jgi:hypothetical protein
MCQKSRLHIPFPRFTIHNQHPPHQSKIYPFPYPYHITTIGLDTPLITHIFIITTSSPLATILIPRSLLYIDNPQFILLHSVLHCCLETSPHHSRQIKFTIHYSEYATPNQLHSCQDRSVYHILLIYLSPRVQIARQIYPRPSRNIVSHS